MGSIYKRGNIFWIKYYKDGKAYYESSDSETEAKAKKLLKVREGQVAEGRFKGLKVEKIKFEELAEDFVNDYKVNGKKSLDRAQRSIRHLQEFFRGMTAINITTDKIKQYIIKRQEEEEATNGTINRELAALKRMFNLGSQMTPPKVNHVPYIPHLKEASPRTGYFEHHEYIALVDAIAEYLKPVIVMAYYTGMRKEEILSLKWHQVDMSRKCIYLEAGTTKNDEARIIYMDGELHDTMLLQKAMRDAGYKETPWVFYNPETGDKIKDFRGSWDAALKKTGLTTKLFHDFRRTGVRNMVRAGIPERVAMMISGHKTRSVFERYNIVNEDDLRKASKKVTEYHEKNRDGYNLVTIENFKEKRNGTKNA